MGKSYLVYIYLVILNKNWLLDISFYRNYYDEKRFGLILLIIKVLVTSRIIIHVIADFGSKFTAHIAKETYPDFMTL